MKYILVEVKDNWSPNNLECEMANEMCEMHCNRCILANAKEAVEVHPPENDYNLKEIKPDGINSCRWEYHGKPVTLFAVKK